jgi:hypothetical protein
MNRLLPLEESQAAIDANGAHVAISVPDFSTGATGAAATAAAAADMAMARTMLPMLLAPPLEASLLELRARARTHTADR